VEHMNTKIALYFGSFNPIHVGHLLIAQTVIDLDQIDELWFVVSPQNPFKKKKTLLAERLRYNLVKTAIENNNKLKVSDIEFKLPKPSYTIDTLTHLEEKFSNKNFSLVMGSDNLEHLHKWKNSDVLIERYQIIVYPRSKDYQIPLEKINATILDAPLLNISSTFIRERIRSQLNINFYVPESVERQIIEYNYYK